MFMKNLKRMLCWILAVTMVLGLLPSTVLATGSTSFKDVKDGDWFKEAVEYVAAEGLMVGVGGNKFDPNGQTTRAMVVTVLHRMEGAPTENSAGFDDVVKNFWYTEAINWAQASGIVEGYGDGTFRPDKTMTREEMVAVFYRYSEYKGYDISATNSLSTYSDRRSIQTYAVDAMGWAVSVGLITGFPDGTIRPQGQSTRAQLATVIMRFNELYIGEHRRVVVRFNLAIDPIISNISEFSDQIVKRGDMISCPADPIAEYGTFVGWYTSQACTEEFDYNSPIVDNTTIYAKWEIDETDTDNDGLIDEYEDHKGTDPNKDDTDGDGLNDYNEILIGTDPLKVDTDNNGVTDYDEDADNDTLTNGLEIIQGTSPVYRDSDFDLLDDKQESIYGTDPLQEDTDGDKASDYWEIENDFDPLIFNSSFVVEIESAEISEGRPVALSVETELNGAQVESLRIEDRSYYQDGLLSASIPGYMGKAYDISVEGNITSATLTFYYDTSIGVIGDEFQPRIYFYNEESGVLEELENQEVSNGIVKAKTTHFSTYILLNKVEFDKVWENEIKEPITDDLGQTASIDVAFVIDTSGSMDGSKLSTAKAALTTFLNALSDNDRAALVSFDSSAETLIGLTQDVDRVKSYVHYLYADGLTSMYKGFEQGLYLLTQPDCQYGYRMIIILSDGSDEPTVNYQDKYASLVENAEENNVVVYTVGVGSYVDTSVLTKIAEETGGAYYHATVASGITDAFHEIQEDTVDVTTDTNNDGIPDYYTQLLYEGKLPLSNGSTEFKAIDLNYDKHGNMSSDYDGDGLKNGDELQIIKDGNKVYARMLSDPTTEHSDMDRINDYEERQNGTNPMRSQYSLNEVGYLCKEDNYLYADFSQEWRESAAQQIGTAFGLVLSLEFDNGKIYRDALADYLNTYAESLDDSTEEEARNIILENLDQMLVNAGKIVDLSEITDLPKNIKELIDTVRGYKVSVDSIMLSYERYVEKIYKFLPETNTFTMSSYSMRSVSLSVIITESPLESELIKPMDFLAVGVKGANDIASTILSFAELRANQKVIDENMDWLNWLRINGYAPAMRSAADDILCALGEGYGAAIFDAVGKDLLVFEVNVLMEILKKNPYIAAVDFVRSVTVSALGLGEKATCLYRMQAYHSMSQALGHFLNDELHFENGYFYDSGTAAHRHLTHLSQIRVLGEITYLDAATAGWIRVGHSKEEEKTLKEDIMGRTVLILVYATKLRLPVSQALDEHVKEKL